VAAKVLREFAQDPFLYLDEAEKKKFFGVSSGSDRATAISGSACVSRAVFGVPPNTERTAFCLNAAHPKKNPGARTGEEVGRETRPTATGTVALPNP